MITFRFFIMTARPCTLLKGPTLQREEAVSCNGKSEARRKVAHKVKQRVMYRVRRSMYRVEAVLCEELAKGDGCGYGVF